ncbi:MAG: hypothetical protein HC919_07710 [Oscillatoriales cyanobacterium SM2_2_1]|nr:hypothetical protein [Oscillatoriales cyanobacterium SM2_2_1]
MTIYSFRVGSDIESKGGLGAAPPAKGFTPSQGFHPQPGVLPLHLVLTKSFTAIVDKLWLTMPCYRYIRDDFPPTTLRNREEGWDENKGQELATKPTGFLSKPIGFMTVALGGGTLLLALIPKPFAHILVQRLQTGPHIAGLGKLVHQPRRSQGFAAR